MITWHRNSDSLHGDKCLCTSCLEWGTTGLEYSQAPQHCLSVCTCQYMGALVIGVGLLRLRPALLPSMGTEIRPDEGGRCTGRPAGCRTQ